MSTKDGEKPSLISKLARPVNIFLKASRKKKLIFLAIFLLAGWGIKTWIAKSKDGKVTYQTAMAEKGTLVNSISASGTITSGNYTNITTRSSGVVSKVYVTNGDTVTKGQTIAEVTLDDYAKERQTGAWLDYLNAKEAVNEAVNNKAVSDINMWKARQDVLDAQQAYDDMLDNDTNPATHEAYTDGERMIITKTLDQSKKAFTVAESKYLDADAGISDAQAKVAAALRDYQENSSAIVAPSAGKVSDLSLAEGMNVTANSSTSQTSGATIVSSQTVGKINNTTGRLIATISLSEIDIVNVKANQLCTLTFDAYSDKTFTGKVLAVNTSGNVSSGVTTYPVTIVLDPVDTEIYPNMAVSTNILTSTKTDVLLVPSTAITTANGQSTVQIKKGNEVSTVQVETGDSNDSETEIVSGINEGDTVVTATILPANNQTDDTSSPFGTVNRSSGTTNSRSPGSSRTNFMFRMGPGL